MMEAETAVLGTLLTSIEEPQPAPSKVKYTHRDSREYFNGPSGHVQWTIAIGKDNTATITMHTEAWEALKEMMK